MIRTKEQELSYELTPTRLFFDDVEEVVRIMCDLLEKTAGPPTGNPPLNGPETTDTISTKYAVSYDLRDLPKIAKSHRGLELTASSGLMSRISLGIDLLSTTWYPTLHAREDARWASFRKLRAVFNKRNRRQASGIGWST
jgi:hypothetical protein